MTFYVEKKLALGSISFGVTPGESEIDNDPELSTGATGEFVRRGSERFFFGGHTVARIICSHVSGVQQRGSSS